MYVRTYVLCFSKTINTAAAAMAASLFAAGVHACLSGRIVTGETRRSTNKYSGVCRYITPTIISYLYSVFVFIGSSVRS